MLFGSTAADVKSAKGMRSKKTFIWPSPLSELVPRADTVKLYGYAAKSQLTPVGTACRNSSWTVCGRCKATSLSVITLTGVGSALTSVGTTVPVTTTCSSAVAAGDSDTSTVTSCPAATVTDRVCLV